MHLFHILASLSLLFHSTTAHASQQFVFSPSSRFVLPSSIYSTAGNVSITSGRAIDPVVLTGPGARVTFDFGQITGGIPNITFGDSKCTLCSTIGLPGYSCGTLCNGIGLAYTEASQFISASSDNSTLYAHLDGELFLPVSEGQYIVPSKWQRGSFRYLTLSMPSEASSDQAVTLQLNGLIFTAQPSLPVPSQYLGGFYSSDDLLNHIWYACAYTLQLSTIAANSSVQHTFAIQPVGWEESAQVQGLAPTDEILSDGAKRDRNPWAGDLAILSRSALVSQADLVPIKNSLKSMLVLQDPISGYFPYAGSPLGNLFQLIGLAYQSDTYHLWTIANFAEYVLASHDTAFAEQYWDQIVRGIQVTFQYLDASSKLFNGTKTSDWGRIGQSGQSSALNALYYHTLTTISRVATTIIRQSANATNWTSIAEDVKQAMGTYLFDSSSSLFWDNTTLAGHQVLPQDGNVLAVLFNVTQDAAQSLRIVEALAARHTPYGASCPELPGAISPFVSGLELLAQLQASPADASRALDLLRVQWGYMLSTFSESTVIEGYGSNGSLTYPFYPDGSAFISHTHGWSTGPMYVLSARVAGLRASAIDVPVADGTWAFQPSVGNSGLSFAQAWFRRQSGLFEVSWTLNDAVFEANISVPYNTTGTIYVPSNESHVSLGRILLDGKKITAAAEDGFIRIAGVAGGNHTVVSISYG